jgi:2-haloacid dehalogenase
VPIKQVLFDLNGTLFDPAAMAAPLAAEGAEELVGEILGDTVLFAMAETLSGSYRDFSELLRAAASRRLALAGRTDRLDAVVAAAKEMRPYPDAAAAIETLRDAGIAAGVLTNSSTETARSLVEAADLPDLEPIVGTDEVRVFKPDRRVYERGIEAAGHQPDEVLLISAHNWDAIGAKRAGLRAAWASRRERVRAPLDPAPDFEAPDLAEVAAQVVRSTPKM